MKVLVNLLDTKEDLAMKSSRQVSKHGHTIPLTVGDVQSTFQGATSQTK